MSESKFTAVLGELAEGLGFQVWPLNQTRGKPKFYVKRGVADLVMFGHKTCLWVETKVDRNTQSHPQVEFEKAVRANGGLYWVVRTTDEFLMLGKQMGWWR